MKAITIVLCFVALAGLASCDKSYTCKCTVSGGSTGGYSVQNETLGKISSDNADAQCSSWENIQQANLQQAGVLVL